MRIIASRSTGAFEFHDENASGYRFSNFFVSRDSGRGPGWYVFGRNCEKYGTNQLGEGRYIKNCAKPNVPMRHYKHWNGLIGRGWHTKREAQAVADFLNARDAS